MTREAAAEAGLANLTTTYVNCYAYEGNKSVAYELYEQMGLVPDWVVVPVGSGPLLYGCGRVSTSCAGSTSSTRHPDSWPSNQRGVLP